MAVTKIIPIHSTIDRSVAYVCNPDKTDGSLLIHSENCFPQTAALTFSHHLSMTRAGGNTVGRHLIQSFAPGEVDPDTAHEIGKKLAAEILQGEYAYLLATHINCGHIHNHFIWGAANIVTHKRYRSNKGTYHEIRDISDRLCKENRLSVIVPRGVGKSYAEYNAEKQGTSWKAKLKAAIDAIIAESADFDDFLKRMKGQDYVVKHGKHISFQAPGQERFTRAKSLGTDYTEDVIRERISSRKAVQKVQPQPDAAPVQMDAALGIVPAVQPRTDSANAPDAPLPITPTSTAPHKKPVAKIIDIEGNEKIKSSPGYTNWATLHNLKTMAESLMFVQGHGGIDEFDKHFKECISDKLTLSQSLNAVDKRIKELTDWRRHIYNYSRTKKVYSQYREMKRSKNNISFFGKDHAEEFRKSCEADIIIHEAAKKALSKVKRPLPSVKDIDNNIAKLRASAVEDKKRYKEKSTELNQLEIIRSNLYKTLPKSKQRTKSHDLSL